MFYGVHMLDSHEAVQMMIEESAGLPGELGDLVEELRAARDAKIEQIGKLVAKRRDEAIAGRKQSGIEQVWQEDEEYYLGIDDVNRDQFPYLKSPSTSGGISRNASEASSRCTAFFNITRQFVDAGAARMGDILLPSTDWNFAVKPTPVQDDLTEVSEALFGDTVQSEQMYKDAQKQAQEKCEKAEKQLHDWLTECQYSASSRTVIDDAARIGTGVLKGPYPDNRIARKTKRGEDGSLVLEILETVVPASKRVDPRNCFPDPDCGGNIQDGAFFVERDFLNARQLKALKKLPGYRAEAIDEVLDEGPDKCHKTDGFIDPNGKTKEDDRFTVWYYYGIIDLDTLGALGADVQSAGSGKHSVPAVVTMVNDTPIKAFLNPLDTGEYPYDFMCWQKRCDSPWGVGIARQGRTPQDMLNASARAMMDNAGLSKAPQIIIRQKAIRPADGKWTLYGGKIWYATEEVDVRNVGDAFLAVKIDMVQQELAAIIELAYKMMEDATGIRFLLQGEQGSAPDTVGGMELLNRNASALLRQLARIYDEDVTEPHIRRYYDFLLQYGPDEAKGDVRIEAVGSTALVERDIQAMESMALLQLSVNPVFGLDPEKAMKQVLISKRMIPDKWEMDEDKKATLANQPAPEPPQVLAAKIRAESEEKIAGIREQSSVKKMAIDVDRDTVYVDAQREKEQAAFMARMEELKIKRELAMLDYANKNSISLNKIKAELAETAMKLKTQKELAGINQVLTPPTEPPGHADDGRAFEQ